MLINNVVLPDTPSNPDSEIVSIPDIPYTTSYDSKAVMPEMYSYCLMISNLLSKHPIQSLARAEGSFATFISLIPILTESFTLKLSYPNSIPLPDREIFKEILLKIGSFSSYILDEMLPKIYTILAETLEEFLQSVNTGLSIEDLENFRENMHWILLIIGYVLVEEDEEHNFVWQSKLVFHYEEVIAGKQNNLDKYVPYIEGCINAPNLLTDPSDVDIVIKIIGTVLAWCALEDTLLKDHGVTVLNIGLCNTSLWCIKRLVSAIGMHIQKFGTADPLAKATENITQLLVDFSLQKSFRVLGIMGDERKTCTDAIELLATLAHVMYHETSKSIFLFSYLSAIKTDQVLVRSALLKVLIQIGSIISDEVKQKTLFEMILVPIRTKFVSMCKDPLERNENFDDLLDCFCAVVHGTNKCTAGFLFEYLRPVLKSSVCLLNEFKDSEIIIGAILQFFDCLTKQINLYCDNHEDMLFIYEMLLLVMRLYEVDHKERYKKLSDKEKASELVLLLEILVNILNKRNQPINWITGELEFTGNRSSIVSTAYNLVICVTGHELLKRMFNFSFYRFLRYSAEMAPECIVKYSPENLLVTVELLKNGLQVDNEKDDLLCNLKDRFEQEISINSALAIAHLSTYFANTTTKSEMATKMFALVIEPVFLMCLNAPWQEDALSSAISTALYSLLCCDEEGCKMYVKTLLSREDNQSNRGTLRNAFRTLMSFSPGKHPDKNEKHEFRDRLKQFLTQVEGLLAIG
uniref:Importin-11 n=1 Tax=Elaeophora elaphi TaxID=1147741 RepID=A0A0R3S230_9BILA